MVKLYRLMSDGTMVFVDFGVPARAEDYVMQGYIVKYPINYKVEEE